MAQDVLAAIITVLAEDGDVSTLVGARIFGEELPVSEPASMPRAAIVVRHASGSPSVKGFVQVESPTFHFYCFGETPFQAEQVQRAVYNVLKYLNRSTLGNVMVYSAELISNTQSMRDPDTTWPYSISSWRCLASEIAAT